MQHQDAKTTNRPHMEALSTHNPNSSSLITSGKFNYRTYGIPTALHSFPSRTLSIIGRQGVGNMHLHQGKPLDAIQSATRMPIFLRHTSPPLYHSTKYSAHCTLYYLLLASSHGTYMHSAEYTFSCSFSETRLGLFFRVLPHTRHPFHRVLCTPYGICTEYAVHM